MDLQQFKNYEKDFTIALFFGENDHYYCLYGGEHIGGGEFARNFFTYLIHICQNSNINFKYEEGLYIDSQYINGAIYKQKMDMRYFYSHKVSMKQEEEWVSRFTSNYESLLSLINEIYDFFKVYDNINVL